MKCTCDKKGFRPWSDFYKVGEKYNIQTESILWKNMTCIGYDWTGIPIFECQPAASLNNMNNGYGSEITRFNLSCLISNIPKKTVWINLYSGPAAYCTGHTVYHSKHDAEGLNNPNPHQKWLGAVEIEIPRDTGCKCHLVGNDEDKE